MRIWDRDTIFTDLNNPKFISPIIAYFNGLISDSGRSYPVNDVIDLDFNINKLQNSYISPIAEYIIDNSQNPVSEIINIFTTKFYEKYEKMFKIFASDYNPIENYNSVEDIQRDNTVGGLNGNTIVSNSGIYAYNSSSLSDTDEQTTTTKGEESETTHSTKSGNIGVVSTQDMILQTNEVYSKINIIDLIYKDMIGILSLDIF